MENTCGYITFVKTGVPDLGCESYDENVSLARPKSRKDRKNSSTGSIIPRMENSPSVQSIPLQSPMDEITSFNVIKKSETPITLKTPNEDYFAVTPSNSSPANEFRSDDCNELLAKELAGLEDNSSDQDDGKFNDATTGSTSLIALSSVCVQRNRKDFIHNHLLRYHSTVIP